MSFAERKGSVNAPNRGGSFRKNGSSFISYDSDFEDRTIPQSVLERRASAISDGKIGNASLPNLVGSSSQRSVNIITREDSKLSARKWLIGPFCFLYMGAYITAYSVFTQFQYNKLTREMFPNVVLNSTSVCYNNESDPNYQMQQSLQKSSAKWSIYFTLASGIPAIFSNFIFGSCTDRFGRKFLFIVPCVGTFLKTAIICIGIYWDFRLDLFLIAFVIEGLTGKMYTVLLVCFTYVADITPPKGKQRSFGIVIIELSMGMAVAIFSFSVGFFIERYKYFYPMLMAACLIIADFVLLSFVPESFPANKRCTEISVCGNLRTAYDIFFGEFNRGRRWMYNLLLVVFILTVFIVFGRATVEPLYEFDVPFCWEPEKMGYYLALRGVLQQAVGMGLVRVFQKFLSDESIAMMGCVSYAISNVIEGLARTDWVLYMVPVVGSVGLLTIPISRSLMSKLTRPDQQGALFATIAAMETSIDVGGTALSNVIYSQTLSFDRGFVFFLFAFSNLVALILLGIYRFGTRRSLAYLTLDVRS